MVITIFLSVQFHKSNFTELQIISNKSDAKVYVPKEISAVDIFFLEKKCLLLILNYSKAFRNSNIMITLKAKMTGTFPFGLLREG